MIMYNIRRNLQAENVFQGQSELSLVLITVKPTGTPANLGGLPPEGAR